MNLKNKIAVVTGAGGGMGSILARHLKDEGVKTILIEKDKSLFESIKDLLDGSDSYTYECDLSDIAACEKLAEEISKKFPIVDLLFNVAGVGIYKPLSHLSLQEWKDSININLNSPFILTKGLFGNLLKSECPIVVNFGSGMGKIATSGRVAYCSSKFGLRGMTLSLAEEYKDSKVKFCHLDLGSVMTNFGTGGIEDRKKKEEQGKKYLDPERLIRNIVDLIKLDRLESEITIYPPGYEV